MYQMCSSNQQFNKLLHLTSYTRYSCALLSDIYCIVLKKNSSEHISFLVDFDVWMMLSFLFLPALAFLVCFLQIRLIVIFNSFSKMKNQNFATFLYALVSKQIDQFSTTVFRNIFLSFSPFSTENSFFLFLQLSCFTYLL